MHYLLTSGKKVLPITILSGKGFIEVAPFRALTSRHVLSRVEALNSFLVETLSLIKGVYYEGTIMRR